MAEEDPIAGPEVAALRIDHDNLQLAHDRLQEAHDELFEMHQQLRNEFDEFRHIVQEFMKRVEKSPGPMQFAPTGVVIADFFKVTAAGGG